MAAVGQRSAEGSYFDFSMVTNYLYENASRIKEVAEPFIFAFGTLFLTTFLINAAITRVFIAIGVMSITFLASKIFNFNESEQDLDESLNNSAERSLVRSFTDFLNITDPD